MHHSSRFAPIALLTFAFSTAALAEDFFEDFSTGQEWQSLEGILDLPGSIASVSFKYPNPDAGDGEVARLLFPGWDLDWNAAQPYVGPAHQTGIRSNRDFQYGTFRTRVKLAGCNDLEALVNGIFTYAFAEDHSIFDGDGNSWDDNHEIDIEVICGEPDIIWLSTHTDHEVIYGEVYQRLASRGIDFATGTVLQTGDAFLNGDVCDPPPGSNPLMDCECNGRRDLDPDCRVYDLGVEPQFLNLVRLDGTEFYELGFEWQPESIEWFIVVDGQKHTLWTYDGPVIPTMPAPFRYNVWYTPALWYNGGDGQFPDHDAIMEIDSFEHLEHCPYKHPILCP